MIFRYFTSFVQRNKEKTIILIMSIAIYFTLAITLLTLNRALPEIASLPFQKIGVGAMVQKTGRIPEHMTGAIFPHSNGPIYQDALAQITSLNFVQDSDQGLYFWYFGDAYFKTALGVRENDSTFSNLLRQNISQGAFDLSETSALITANFAQKNNLHVGDTITFGKNAYTVTGILQENVSGNIVPADIYITLTEAQKIAVASKELQRIYAFKNTHFVNVIALDVNPEWQGNKEQAIKALDEDYIVFSEKTFSKEVLEQIQIVSSLGKTVFVVLGVIVLTIFSLLIRYSLKTREREIAVLRMIGWSFKDLKKQFVGESALLLAISLILGNILAYAALLALRMQSVSLELPWEISAKPHFLPQENAINRTLTTNIPITFDWLQFVELSALFLLIFSIVHYLIFRRLSTIKPSKYLKN